MYGGACPVVCHGDGGRALNRFAPFFLSAGWRERWGAICFSGMFGRQGFRKSTAESESESDIYCGDFASLNELWSFATNFSDPPRSISVTGTVVSLNGLRGSCFCSGPVSGTRKYAYDVSLPII